MPKIKRFKNEKYNHLAEIEHQLKVEEIGEEAKLTIYGDIGESYWYDSTSAGDVERILKDIKADTIHVHINSGGGDAFDGIAIFNQLRNHGSKIVIHIDGLAASAASLIAMAADELIMNTGSMLMIHEASTIAWGNKSDFKKTLNALEGIDKSIADIYMTRFLGEREEIDQLIAAESWFTASEAVELGLADSIDEKQTQADPEDIKNSILQRFRNKNQQPNSAPQPNILDRFKPVAQA